MNSISFMTVLSSDNCVCFKDVIDNFGDQNVFTITIFKDLTKLKFEGFSENEKVASLSAVEMAAKAGLPFLLNSKPVVTVFLADRKFIVVEIPPLRELSSLPNYEIKSEHDDFNHASSQARKIAILGRCSLIFPKF